MSLSDQSGIWAVVYLLSLVLKVCHKLFKISFIETQGGGELRSSKKLYGITFPSSTLSAICLELSVSLKLTFLVL